MKNKLLTALVLFPIILALNYWILNIILQSKSTSIKNIISGNILTNSDFKEGLKYWVCDKGVSLTNIGNQVYVHVVGRDKLQTRFMQNIDVVSGIVYQLKFDLTGKQNGAFPIYRDTKTGKEEYIFCGGNDNAKKRYTWKIKPKRTGRNFLFFSTCQDGDYFYSNITLSDSTSNAVMKSIFIGCIILFLSILFEVIFLIFLYYSSHLNIFFTAFILLLVILPVVKISNEAKSDIENRNLATYKPIILDGKINTSYGKDFNDWLNDRFFFRNKILETQCIIKYSIDKRLENKFAFIGNNNWFFLRSNIKHIVNYKEDEIDNYKKTLISLRKFKKFCENSKISLYIIVAPYSEEIYSSELAGITIEKEKCAIGKTISKLIKDSGINMLYAYDVINDSKQEGLLYYKTDHHWTKLAAFKTYKLIMNSIKKDYPNIKPILEDQYTISLAKKEEHKFEDTLKRFNLPNAITKRINSSNTKYHNYNFKNSEYVQDNKSYYDYKYGNDKTLFIFGDSFVNNIRPFFGNTFSKTYYFVKPLQIYMPNIEKLILDYKPDIAVMIIYSQNFSLIKNWY